LIRTSRKKKKNKSIEKHNSLTGILDGRSRTPNNLDYANATMGSLEKPTAGIYSSRMHMLNDEAINPEDL
jgi:hypothetical protein